MVCLSRPYPFKFSKGSLPQILLGPFLNALFVPYVRPNSISRSVKVLLLRCHLHIISGQLNAMTQHTCVCYDFILINRVSSGESYLLFLYIHFIYIFQAASSEC